MSRSFYITELLSKQPQSMGRGAANRKKKRSQRWVKWLPVQTCGICCLEGPLHQPICSSSHFSDRSWRCLLAGGELCSPQRPKGPIHLLQCWRCPGFSSSLRAASLQAPTAPAAIRSRRHRRRVLQLAPSGTSSCEQNFVRSRVLHKTALLQKFSRADPRGW